MKHTIIPKNATEIDSLQGSF